MQLLTPREVVSELVNEELATKATFYRHVKESKISPTVDDSGNNKYERSEVDRYKESLRQSLKPKKKSRETTNYKSRDASKLEEAEEAINDLRLKVALLEERNRSFQAQLETKEAHVSDLQRSLTLIEYQLKEKEKEITAEPVAQPQPDKKVSLASRLGKFLTGE